MMITDYVPGKIRIGSDWAWGTFGVKTGKL
jgi:hypothetical protein